MGLRKQKGVEKTKINNTSSSSDEKTTVVKGDVYKEKVEWFSRRIIGESSRLMKIGIILEKLCLDRVSITNIRAMEV